MRLGVFPDSSFSYSYSFSLMLGSDWLGSINGRIIVLGEWACIFFHGLWLFQEFVISGKSVFLINPLSIRTGYSLLEGVLSGTRLTPAEVI